MPELSDRFLCSITGVTSTLRVRSFEAVEAMSEMFRLEASVLSEDPGIDPSDVLGKQAQITLVADAGERYFVGIVSRFIQAEVGKTLSRYLLEIVPKVWRLTQRMDCRIFQSMSASDIIRSVFDGAGLASGDDYRLSLQGTYTSRTYCVQYQETDFDFVSRLMEAEGINYFFEHTDGKCVLVLADRSSAFVTISGTSTVQFEQAIGGTRADDRVYDWKYNSEIKSGKVTIRDYAFTTPSLQLEGQASASSNTDLERYGYENVALPGDMCVTDAITAAAKVRLETEQSRTLIGDGSSNCQRFTAGYTFTQSENPRDAMNASFLLTRVKHEGSDPAMTGGSDDDVSEDVPVYQNYFQCVPAAATIHPIPITPLPRIDGVQTAVVVGPSGEEIYTDANGRVKVQFFWDRLGKKDDKSSCWIRVGSLWASAAWGAIHIPRITQEVIVAFLNGNPDQPLIVGCVYHGTNTPPYALPDNKTQSTVKSNSSPGGDGSNELRFEDKKSSEEVYLHAQKDLTRAIENDENSTVGHDQTLNVKNDQTEEIGNDQTLKVDHDQTITVSNNQSTTVSQGSRSVTISQGNDALTISQGSMTVQVSAGKCSVEAAQQIELKVGSSTIVLAPDGITVKAPKISIQADADVDIKGANIQASADVAATLKGNASCEVSASGEMTVKGGMLMLN